MNKRRIKKALTRLANLPKGKYFFYYFLNKIKHFYLKSAKSTKVAFPSNIMIELSNQCNLACTTCPREYAFGKAMDKGLMLKNHAKSIVDELWPYLDSVGLTGMGETFIYKDIADIADYIKQKNKGIIISLSTNAMLPNFIELVSKVIGKVDTIQVSIDGIGEIYELIRKKASFEVLDRNLQTLVGLCKNTKTTLMLNMVVTKENYHQMPDLVEYANKSGVEYLDFSQLNLAAVTDIPVSYYAFYKSEEFLLTLKKLNEIINVYDKLNVTYNFKTEKSFRSCPFPWSHFYITWDGFMVPCCAKPFPKELNFGNVFDQNVMTVLNSKKFMQHRNLWYKNVTPKFCEKCHFTSL